MRPAVENVRARLITALEAIEDGDLDYAIAVLVDLEADFARAERQAVAA